MTTRRRRGHWTSFYSRRASVAGLVLGFSLVMAASWGWAQPPGPAPSPLAGAGRAVLATGAGNRSASTSVWRDELELDIPGSIEPSCSFPSLSNNTTQSYTSVAAALLDTTDLFSANALASCRPAGGPTSLIAYRLFPSPQAMVDEYDALYPSAALHPPDRPCRVGWAPGECVRAAPDARLWYLMDGTRPLLAATYTAAAIMAVMLGRPGGEAALASYFSSGAPQPDAYQPVSSAPTTRPKPPASPAARLMAMVPAGVRSNSACAAQAKPAYPGASATVRCQVANDSVVNLYYNLFPSAAAMGTVYRSLVTKDARTTMGSNCTSGWAVGECGYGIDGKAAGRYLRMVYRGAPWVIWTSDRLDVITEAEGYGTGGAGTTIGGKDLLQYWTRGLADPT